MPKRDPRVDVWHQMKRRCLDPNNPGFANYGARGITVCDRWLHGDGNSSAFNRRNCIYVDCDGERVTLKEYCRRKGMTYRPVVKRIRERGWPLEKALTIPVGTGKHKYQWRIDHAA